MVGVEPAPVPALIAGGQSPPLYGLIQAPSSSLSEISVPVQTNFRIMPSPFGILLPVAT